VPSSEIPANLARDIKLVIFDVDGVLTDNGVYLGQTGSGEPVEMKRFDILDGLGIKMLERGGMKVAFVSGRISVATTLRAAELGVECHQANAGHKMDGVRELMTKYNLAWDQIAWLGDDLPDLATMRRVGLPVAVANAIPAVKDAAVWTTTRTGGNGAAREFCEELLKARGQWERLAEEYVNERS
jgi:3-deoxy-D-manno-octulosonate 8-phosphate phosphatase (KDO 8-P phosphatase)